MTAHIFILRMKWSTFNTGLMPYGSEWRAHRRIFQRYFKPDALPRFIAQIQTNKNIDFLKGILNSPDDFESHIRTYVLDLQREIILMNCVRLPAATIMAAMYGHDISPQNDYFVDLAERSIRRLSNGIFPGASLFYAFPILRFLPAWFPGAEFKRYGLEGRKVALESRDIPMEAVKRKMVVRIVFLPIFIHPDPWSCVTEGRKRSNLCRCRAFGNMSVKRRVRYHRRCSLNGVCR